MTRARRTGAAAATRRTPSWPARRSASSAWATSAGGSRSSPARSACACSATTSTSARTSSERRGVEPVPEPGRAAAAGGRADLPHAADARDQHMIDHSRLALMKPGAIYINTSRGGVQDEDALFEALHARPAAAPPGSTCGRRSRRPRDNKLFNLDNVVCSPHVAGVTRRRSGQASLQVTEEMLRVLRGEMPARHSSIPRCGRASASQVGSETAMPIDTRHPREIRADIRRGASSTGVTAGLGQRLRPGQPRRAAAGLRLRFPALLPAQPAAVPADRGDRRRARPSRWAWRRAPTSARTSRATASTRTACWPTR